MLRRFGEFLLAKDINASFLALMFALLPFVGLQIGFVAAIIVGFVTLQKGVKSGLLVVLWVALPAIALLVLHQPGDVNSLFLRCMLILSFALLWRRYHSLGLVLEAAALLGVVAVVILHLVKPDIMHWWTTQLLTYLNILFKEAADWRLPVTRDAFVQQVAPIATGVTAFFVLGSVFLELLVARWWQAFSFQPDAFGNEFIVLRIGMFASIAAALLFSAALVTKAPFAIDALPVLLLPFILSGLSFLHYLARKKKELIILLVLTYVGFMFLPRIFLIAVVSVGFFDSFVDFRKRVVKS